MSFCTGQRKWEAEKNLISIIFIYTHQKISFTVAVRMDMIPAKKETRGLGMRGTMCFTSVKTASKGGCAYWLSAYTINPLGDSHIKFIWNVCLHVDLLPTFPGRVCKFCVEEQRMNKCSKNYTPTKSLSFKKIANIQSKAHTERVFWYNASHLSGKSHKSVYGKFHLVFQCYDCCILKSNQSIFVLLFV